MAIGPLAWHRRLEARVIVAVATLVALSLGAVLVATTRAVTARSLERTAAELDAARAAFDPAAIPAASIALHNTGVIGPA